MRGSCASCGDDGLGGSTGWAWEAFAARPAEVPKRCRVTEEPERASDGCCRQSRPTAGTDQRRHGLCLRARLERVREALSKRAGGVDLVTSQGRPLVELLIRGCYSEPPSSPCLSSWCQRLGHPDDEAFVGPLLSHYAQRA